MSATPEQDDPAAWVPEPGVVYVRCQPAATLGDEFQVIGIIVAAIEQLTDPVARIRALRYVLAKAQNTVSSQA